MLEWLIELLTPFFTSLGVSAADINSYIHSLSIYIYIIAHIVYIIYVFSYNLYGLDLLHSGNIFTIYECMLLILKIYSLNLYVFYSC